MSSVQSEVKVGLFILVSLLLFGTSIFIMGREKELFSDQVIYYTIFQDVKGLSSGAPIRLGGLTVGRVGDITFDDDPSSNNITVEVKINSNYTQRLREDALTSIATQGLLGDSYLSINSGNSKVPLAEGSIIHADATLDINQMAGNVSDIVNSINRATDIAERILGDLHNEGVKPVIDAAKTLNDILHDIKKKNGILHALVYSNELAKSFNTTINSINKIVHSVRTGPSLTHDLLFQNKNSIKLHSIKKTLKNLQDTSAQIKRITDHIENGKGTIHSLVYDGSPSATQNLMSQLNEIAEKLKIVATALAGGKGSLGALLIDSSLYNNLVEVTDQAKRSFLLKQALKASLQNEQ